MCFRKEKMRVLVFGSKDWTDYNEVIRQLTVVIDDRKHFYPDDNECVFVHRGIKGAENMVTEYIGKTERYLRQKGYKIKEELIRDKSTNADYYIIEQGADFALVFGDSIRTKSCLKLIEALEMPHRYIKE
jgi:hypothetical protein